MKRTSLIILSSLILFAGGCDYFSQEEKLCVIMEDEIITLTIRNKEDKKVYGKNAMDCSAARSIVKTRTELNQKLKELKERERELTQLQNRISYTTEALNRAEREKNRAAVEQERRDKNRRQGEALMRLGESFLKGSSSKASIKASIGVFRGSEFSGHNQICYYDDETGSRKAITVGAADQCPR